MFCTRLQCYWGRIIPITLFITSIMSFRVYGYAQNSLNQNTGYLFQKVGPMTSFLFVKFKHNYVLPCFFGYYVVNEETLQDYFDHDTVDYERAVMLCDPASVMFTDSAITKVVKRSTRIKDILLLDDSEIYEIGGCKYIIRKIRYAYLDNSQVKVYLRGYDYYLWDDISDDDTVYLEKSYEVGQLYERNYYQCYHHLLEILPTPTHISKHIWKRLYQLGE